MSEEYKMLVVSPKMHKTISDIAKKEQRSIMVVTERLLREALKREAKK